MEEIKMQEAGLLISYLKVLLDGKVRPSKLPRNRNDGYGSSENQPITVTSGIIRDAKDNIPEITAVKERLNRMFMLDETLIERERKSPSLKYDYGRSAEPFPLHPSFQKVTV